MVGMPGTKNDMGGRVLKQTVHDLLARKDFIEHSGELREYEPVRLLSPLFASLCSSSNRVRWHGVHAFGQVVSDLAEKKLEKARTVMRRFMWSLNDESGGIGWGAPEAMGEIMACHKGLAQEFHLVLVSYIYDNPVGPDNFLEYLPLRRGAFWGLARLAAVRPELTGKANRFLQTAFEEEEDAEILGLACMLASAIKMDAARVFLQDMVNDTRSYPLFWNGQFQTVILGQQASKSLRKIQQEF